MQKRSQLPFCGPLSQPESVNLPSQMPTSGSVLRARRGDVLTSEWLVTPHLGHWRRACLHRCSPNTRSRSRFRLYLRSASIEYSDFEPMRKQVETWQRSELADYHRQGRHLRGVCGEPTILARIERGDCCCYFCARVECASASARRKASKSAQIRDVVLPSRVLMTGSALFDE